MTTGNSDTLYGTGRILTASICIEFTVPLGDSSGCSYSTKRAYRNSNLLSAHNSRQSSLLSRLCSVMASHRSWSIWTLKCKIFVKTIVYVQIVFIKIESLVFLQYFQADYVRVAMSRSALVVSCGHKLCNCASCDCQLPSQRSARPHIKRWAIEGTNHEPHLAVSL